LAFAADDLFYENDHDDRDDQDDGDGDVDDADDAEILTRDTPQQAP